MQERPHCFKCHERIDTDPIFEAPCGHDQCPSAVFHGVCLMEWREHIKAVHEEVQRWLRQHQEHDPGRGT